MNIEQPDAFPAHVLAFFLEAAPWLVLGLAAAGLIKAWVPEAAMARWLGGRGPWPVIKAAFVGAPLPLCSCGVLPAALGLRRAGASKGSTVSFLVATPETGADSVAVSYAMLGPFMTVVRPVAAILSAVAAGLLADWTEGAAQPAAARERRPDDRPETTCCAARCGSGCSTPEPPAQGFLARTLAGLRYAATDILDDIAPWLAGGLLLAGLVAALVPPMALAQWGSGLPAMLVMLAVGIPMYICATASTPVAAALLLAGVSPGTVLVFLLAGPATNIATLAVVRREMGSRVLAAYLAGVGGMAVMLGLAVDALASSLGAAAGLGPGGAVELLPLWLEAGCAGLLTLLAIKPLRRRLLPGL